MKIIYLDGIFDLFHKRHLESFKKAKELFDDVYLIIGVVSDEVATKYKRKPIINENDRADIIKSIGIVNKVILGVPLKANLEFLEKYKIDYVVHGFSNNEDFYKQKDYYQHLIDTNKFIRIEYYNKTSTTEIINNIKRNY